MEQHVSTVGLGGRVVIPASLRKQLMMDVGSRIYLKLENGTLTIKTMDQVVKEVQHYFTSNKKYQGSMVDDFIESKRKEVQIEAERDAQRELEGKSE